MNIITDKQTDSWNIKVSVSNHKIYTSVCSINTQLFVHAKSSSISHFINGKSKNLQLWLRYLSGIVTSTFKVGTGGCVGQFASPSF